MKIGGNERARKYFEEHPLDPPTYCVKFDCESADQYRRILKRQMCEDLGREYEELPPWKPTRRMETNTNRPVVGGGSLIPQNEKKKNVWPILIGVSVVVVGVAFVLHNYQ